MARMARFGRVGTALMCTALFAVGCTGDGSRSGGGPIGYGRLRIRH